MITTDYTKEANPNTLCHAPLSRYRATHWMLDILKNFMSSPINIKDERLCGLLFKQDGNKPDECRALFQIALPYTQDTRKAGNTPAILVSSTESSWPIIALTRTAAINTANVDGYNSPGNYRRREVGLTIAIVTESVDGTSLLTDIIEEFLLTHSLLLCNDGPVDQFNVMGSSAIQEIKAPEAGNAKPLYQCAVSVKLGGGITWSEDTQGPVFRGVDYALT